MNRQNKKNRLSVIWLEFFGSMYLAITLLMTLAIASVIGTVLLQNQPYNEYRQRFGDFWFEMFEMMGLYDVYTAAWFLLILVFLVISTSVCVYRNTPNMLREMKSFRLHAKRKSLLAFHHKEEFTTKADISAVEQKISLLLVFNKYQYRRKENTVHTLIASVKGRYNKIGYVLTHLSIILICIGGLIDGNVGLKWKVMNNQVVPLVDDMVVSDVPDNSRLKPGDSLSFRGNRSIPEGSTVNAVVLDYKDGYVLQELPFA
ncbi:MAG: cytochrome c biogenesis protein ResB, partial [Gammaproteobacteria bacterium]|nr:cytochrome c biogenesis protein ResB [Gammaproteobacteria bacterium]